MAPRRPTTSTKEKEEHQGPAPDPTATLTAALEIFNDDWAKDLNLYGKIAAISGHLGRIPKNGWNKFNSYAYVLESDLVEAIRWYLSAARILIFTESLREHNVLTFEGQAKEGRSRDILTDNVYVYRVADGKTGESFTFEVNGQGSDPRDKGSNKASTSAMKFAYLRLFNIASGEDAEADVRGEQDEARGSAPAGVTVTPGNVADAQRGGKQENATGAQIKAVSNLSNQLNLGGPGLVTVIKSVLGADVELPEDEKEHGKVLAAYLKGLKGEEIGQLIYTLDQTVKASVAEDGDLGSGE